MKNKGKINNIQILRAIAALNVVIFHCIGGAASYNFSTPYTQFLKGWGANGVDLFFVISGFIMIYTGQNSRSSPSKFFVKRIFRIVPVYWALTLLWVTILLLLPTLLRSAQFDFGKTLASLFFLTGPIYNDTPALYVGWTLEFEFLFYTFFAMSMFVKDHRLSQILLLIAVFASPLLVPQLDKIMFEFAYGMIVALIIMSKKISFRTSWVCLIAGILFLCGTIGNAEVAKAGREIYWGLPATLIVAGAINIKQIQNKILLFLGNASYSIYLVQVFTIPATLKVLTLILPSNYGDFTIIICTLVTILIGAISYQYIERPSYRWLVKKFP